MVSKAYKSIYKIHICYSMQKEVSKVKSFIPRHRYQIVRIKVEIKSNLDEATTLKHNSQISHTINTSMLGIYLFICST